MIDIEDVLIWFCVKYLRINNLVSLQSLAEVLCVHSCIIFFQNRSFFLKVEHFSFDYSQFIYEPERCSTYVKVYLHGLYQARFAITYLFCT